MVRLVITDFSTPEDNEAFYLNDEFDSQTQVFAYQSFKKNAVSLSKYDIHDEIYSLNLLSKKHLKKNQFLIHIADGEYIILFNHKTVYSAKINANFITDDMIKSILITKHIAMLSSGGAIDKLYYVINSKYKSAIENILKQNTRNEKGDVIAQSLGEIKDLVKPLTELDTMKGHFYKNTFSLFFTVGILWIMAYGLDIASEKLFGQESLDNLKRELKVQNRLVKREQTLYNKSIDEYKKLTECIRVEGIK